MKTWLVTYENDNGIIFAPTKSKANELKRFLRLRGQLTEVDENKDLALIRVCGWYSQIEEARRLLVKLRAKPR